MKKSTDAVIAQNKHNKVAGFLSQNIILAALVVMCLILTICTPRFLTVKNIMNILMQSTTMGMAAVGMTYVVITGGIDLSVGSVLALCAALGAAAMKNGAPVVIGVLIMLSVSTAFGIIQGILISRLKVPAFIVTLAGMSIGRGFTLVFTQGKTISGIPKSYQLIGNGYIAGVIPIAVLIMFLVYLVAFYVLKFTTFGRGIYALGGNREATELSGIHTKRIEMCVYGVSGFTAGLAAMILTARLGTAVSTAGDCLEMDAIGAAVIGGASLAGGRGTMKGTLVGVLILSVLNNGMNLLNVNTFYTGVVRGVVILIAVLLDTLKNRSELS